MGVALPILASATAFLAAAPPAQAAEAGDGTVKVRVVREVNANGTWDKVLEPGMDKVQVRLTDDAGNTITATTDANGVVTLNPAGSALKGGKYRVQVINPKPGVLYSAFAAREGLDGAPDKLSSTEEFVDVGGGKDVEFTTAYWNPADYCQKNAELVTACIGRDTVPGANEGSARTLLGFPYNARGENNQTTDLSDKDTIGAVYGIGYSKPKKWIFSGAMARRGSNYGPGGAGAIYLTDRESQETTQFTTVPNVGTTAHVQDVDQDLAFQAVVAKESLGDVEVSEDGKDLYVVNLNDKKLYRYDATQPTADAPKASYAIPDPGCSTAGDWRPYGLGVQDGEVFVGGVCSAQSSGDKADMRAVVQKFDPTSGRFTGTIMNDKLDFPRGIADNLVPAGCRGDRWYPWADVWRDKQDGRTCAARNAYPQPILADIVVETNGDLVLGFRDRYNDQHAYALVRTPGGPRSSDPVAGGDLNRACPGADGKFVLDGNGGCKNNATVQNSNQPADQNVKEFYPGDWRQTLHMESAFAGIALSKVEDTVASNGIDVTGDVYNNGTTFVNRWDGTSPRGAQGGNVLLRGFGKGAAMADLEVLCDEAPIQIGNRVWYDVDKDGIQDPGEKPVPGATVNLYDENGNLVATTTTTRRGEYYFDSVNDGLKFRTKYTIKIDNPADYEEGGPLYRWAVTKNDAGDNDFIDSDGKVPPGGRFPEHTITTGSAGQDNHTYDFGYNQPTGEVRVWKADAKTGRPLAGAVFQLWQETNGTSGLQTTGEADTKVGATCTTDSRGLCKRGNQRLGSYYWQETQAPASHEMPQPNVFPVTLTWENREAGASVTAKNQPKPGGVRVVKVDAKTGRPLAGAVFQLWQETNGRSDLQTTGTADTKVGGACTTDSGGLCRHGDRPLGTYYWQETKAPASHQLPKPNVFPLTLTRENREAGASVTVKNQPKPGEVRVVKRDAKTRKVLPGAVFQLWRETNGRPGLQRTGARPDTRSGAGCSTDGNGQCRFTVPNGAYYLYETAVPEGYTLPRNRVSGPHRITDTTKRIVATLYNSRGESGKKKK